MGAPDRIPLLAGRVRWLDRYRHPIAAVLALIGLRVILVRLAGALDADWTDLQVIIYGVMLAACLWWGVEVVLAYLTALWETEYDRLSREHGLPRAILRRRRRRRASP